MGAYYTALNIENNERLDSWTFSNGAKLMEHSYIGNNYIDAVLYEIAEGGWKNKPFVWLCDYNEGEYSNNWETSVKISSSAENPDWLDYSDAIILNTTKKEYIDLCEYKLNWIGPRTSMIHPFTLLTNSEDESMGGGDYHLEDNRRGLWRGDCFVVTLDRREVPHFYKNITKDVIFYEDEELANYDELQTKSILEGGSKGEDLNKREVKRVINVNNSGYPSKSEILNALRNNKESLLSFKKADGTKVVRKATLDIDYEGSSNSNNDNDKYVWFKDLEANGRLKRFVLDNFINLEGIA